MKIIALLLLSLPMLSQQVKHSRGTQKVAKAKKNLKLM